MKQRKSVVFDVLFTAACLLLVLFYAANSVAIQHFFTRKLVIPYLQKTNTVLNYPNLQQSFVGWAIYLLLLLMIGFPLLRYVWIHRKRRYPRAIICLSGLLTIFYIHARCENSPWMFYPLNYWPKYVDIFGFTAILFVFFGFRARLRVTPYKKSGSILASILNHYLILELIKLVIDWKDRTIKLFNEEININPLIIVKNYNELLRKQINRFDIDDSKGFSFDNPIDKSKNTLSDTLGRTVVAKTIADKIRNTFDTKSAFAVGISGEWGSGKTSFLNLIKQELESHPNEPRIIIQFSPWKNHSDTTIITDFFDTLGSELAQYDFHLKRQLQRYANVLVDAEVDTLTKYAKQLKSVLSGTQSVAEMYEDIDARISAIGYQIIIFIDDLDRLYKKEILETLKLIRNSAAFGNVVFVTAYHKKYVIDNIKEEIKECDNYLDKIFQMEFELPMYYSIIYIRHFINILSQCNLFDAKSIERISNLNNREIDLSLSYFYYNKQSFGLDSYSFFSHNNFSSIRDITRFANQFIIAYDRLSFYCDVIDLLLIEFIRFKKPDIYRRIFMKGNNIFISENSPDCDVIVDNNSEIKFIYTSIMRSKKDDEKLEYLSMSNPSSFDRYFIGNLLDSDISIDDFRNAYSLNEEKFISKCCEWINNDKEQSFFYLLKLIVKQEYHLNLLFTIGQNIRTSSDEFLLLPDINCIEDEVVKIIQYELQNKLDKEIKDFFVNAKYPFLFELYVLKGISYQKKFLKDVLIFQDELIYRFIENKNNGNVFIFVHLIDLYRNTAINLDNKEKMNEIKNRIIDLGNLFMSSLAIYPKIEELKRLFNYYSGNFDSDIASSIFTKFYIKKNSIENFLDFYFGIGKMNVTRADWSSLISHFKEEVKTNKHLSNDEINKINLFDSYFKEEHSPEMYIKFMKDAGYGNLLN